MDRRDERLARAADLVEHVVAVHADLLELVLAPLLLELAQHVDVGARDKVVRLRADEDRGLDVRARRDLALPQRLGRVAHRAADRVDLARAVDADDRDAVDDLDRREVARRRRRGRGLRAGRAVVGRGRRGARERARGARRDQAAAEGEAHHHLRYCYCDSTHQLRTLILQFPREKRTGYL